MYYVPDGTEQCGYYECKECGSRFLDLKIAPTLVCPYCGEEADMEIGPDEEMPKVVESAKLIQMVRGTEEVEKMDKAYGMEADKLKEYMGDAEKESMKKDLAITKAVDLIMDNVKERAKAKKKADAEESTEE